MDLNEYREILYKARVWILRNRLDKALIIVDALPEESRNFREIKYIYDTIHNKQGEALRALKHHFILKDKSYMQKAQNAHPKAYSFWTEEETGLLKKYFLNDTKIENISKIFGRSPRAIELRLIKLGLIAENEPSAIEFREVCSICEDPIDEDDDNYRYDERNDSYAHVECIDDYWGEEAIDGCAEMRQDDDRTCAECGVPVEDGELCERCFLKYY